MALTFSLIAGCAGTKEAASTPVVSSSSTAAVTETTNVVEKGPQKFKLWLGWAATINNNSLVQKNWELV